MEGGKKFGLVTGGFDPMHGGHVDYIRAASRLCTFLFVGVNDDAWLVRKKGYRLLPQWHRVAVCEAIRGTYMAFPFSSPRGDAVPAIEKVREHMIAGDTLILFNGGDRDSSNVPQAELDAADEVRYGIGGRGKRGSSSDFFDLAVKERERTKKGEAV